MNIMIFAVSASSGGPLSILNQYYNQALADQENSYVFVVGTAILQEQSNIKVLSYPKVKKSRIKRIFFDWFYAHKLVKKYNIDSVISLQNAAIRKISVHQTVYFHQALSYGNYKFKVFQFDLWFRQNVLNKYIVKTLKKADKIIVQTNFLKERLTKDADKNKIVVVEPLCDTGVSFAKHSDAKFFYPSSAQVYKNHWVILNACKILSQKNLSYKTVLTINPTDNCYARKLYKFATKHNLSVDFTGAIPQQQVFAHYKNSVLIFPSLTESFGLPLLEAKNSNCPIFAVDLPYAREVLNGYENAEFFWHSDSKVLARLMENFILETSISASNFTKSL